MTVPAIDCNTWAIWAVSPPRKGLDHWDLLAVVLYITATVLIAVVASRKRGSTEEFFLGGRSLPWFAIGLSIMATLMSTISYLAVPGEVIGKGITIFAGYLAIPFAMVVVLWGWVPFFMRLRMTSAYEYLEMRFSYPARLLAATLFIVLRLGWMAVVIYTSSLALRGISGLQPFVLPGATWHGQTAQIDPLFFWMALVGLFTTFYSSLGGFRAVIWTDVMQSMVMLAGTLITLGYVAIATGTGPVDWWHATSLAGIKHDPPVLFSLNVTVRITVATAMLHTFFWTICTHGSDQMIVQRYFSTDSLRSARRSYLISAMVEILVGILLALCGLALLSFYLEYPNWLGGGVSLRTSADKVFPHFIAHQLQWGLGGVILAALFAAAMSSVSSGVNSCTAVATTDIFIRLFPRGERFFSGVTLARCLSFATGIVATFLAYWVAYLGEKPDQNIMDLMAKGFNMFLGPLAALFFVGMFLPRCTGRSAIPAVLGGLVVSIVWNYWKEINMLLGSWHEGMGVPTFTMAVAVPCLSTLLLAFVLSWIVENGQPNPGAAYSWFAIMRRPVPKPGELHQAEQAAAAEHEKT
jgi:SSS family solute:Na+ symporter